MAGPKIMIDTEPEISPIPYTEADPVSLWGNPRVWDFGDMSTGMQPQSKRLWSRCKSSVAREINNLLYENKPKRSNLEKDHFELK